MENEKMSEASAVGLMTAMHAHLQEIAKRPLDAVMLLELEHTCLLARQLFAISRAPDAFNKSQLLAGPGGQFGGFGVNMAMPTYVGSPASSNPTETFGVQAIKELVALLPGVMPKPPAELEPPPPQLNYSELASAMAVAKGAGDDKLYDQLFARLETEQARAELVNKSLAIPPPPVVETSSSVVEAA